LVCGAQELAIVLHQSLEIIKSRTVLNLALPLVVGSLVGISALIYFTIDSKPKKFDDFALGKENTTSLEFVNGVQVHCNDVKNSHECINGYNNSRPGEDIVLWLGNSQLDTINQIKPGDVTAAYILHRYFAADSKYYLTFSQPNASLQEHYLLFEYLTHQLPVTNLVLPIVFDDMRETGIRHSLIDAFNNQAVSKRLYNTVIGRKLISLHGNQNSIANDMTALDGTVQKQSEKYLNEGLNEIWRIWEQRVGLRGSFLTSLYVFRNWLFGINPSSIRRIIPGRYSMNLDALKAVFQTANEQGIKVLLYIPPLRNDVKVPYDLDQYGKFKYEIQLLAQKNEAKFVNLEHLVPAELWGTKPSTTLGRDQELDFMHFQAGGHELLANALYGELKALWSEETNNDF